MFRKFTIYLGVICLLNFQAKTFAFALLGPIQPWMQASNGVILPGDIGGPMDIGHGYRWNVPVITYGFDKSFLDYFGTNGVAAVEGAIQILNNLPPASNTNLTSFPQATYGYNYTAQSQSLYDLKSQALALLLEQMGLAQPERNVFVLKQWSSWFAPQNYPALYGITANMFLNQALWPDWFIPDFIAMRNFDPQTLDASQYVNGTLYTALIFVGNHQNRIPIYPADPFANQNTAVAGGVFGIGSGVFFTGLTYEDFGGLRYLISTNTIHYETLLPGISGVGANSNSLVNGAWRPGVDKITFVPHPMDSLSNKFLTMTNQFTDTYITNGNAIQQSVQRVIMQPDILFTADTGNSSFAAYNYSRTGTTNWINNATANGNTNGEGPGVIQPPVQICFNKLENVFSGGFSSDEQVGGGANPWGSFDGSTNTPIIYPILQATTNRMTVRMWLMKGVYPVQSAISFTWTPTNQIGTPFTFQTSSNLLNWVNLFTVTNDGSVCTYLNDNPKSPRRFYRLIPQ